MWYPSINEFIFGVLFHLNISVFLTGGIWADAMDIWTKWRINYVFIFELDPRTRLTHYQIWDEAPKYEPFLP